MVADCWKSSGVARDYIHTRKGAWGSYCCLVGVGSGKSRVGCPGGPTIVITTEEILSGREVAALTVPTLKR